MKCCIFHPTDVSAIWISLTHKLQLARVQQKRKKEVIKEKVKDMKKCERQKNVDVHHVHFSMCGSVVK
jgi:hypothetical protein